VARDRRLPRRDPGRDPFIRHRRAGDGDPALALLSLVAVVGFVALVAQILRYPQLGGKEIKASYLLFAAPGFAIFSVASWLALARRRSWVGPTLTAVAALYLVSYGTHLASALGQRSAPHADLAPRYGFYDLRRATSLGDTADRKGTGRRPVGRERRHRHGARRARDDPAQPRDEAQRAAVHRARLRLHRHDHDRL
jgi:hypothetical protein